MTEKKTEKQYETYELYLKGHEQDIEQGNPFAVEVRDAEDYRRMVVRAKISPLKERLENAAPLYLREEKWEQMLKDNVWIQIIDELDDDEVLERPESAQAGIKPYGAS